LEYEENSGELEVMQRKVHKECQKIRLSFVSDRYMLKRRLSFSIKSVNIQVFKGHY